MTDATLTTDTLADAAPSTKLVYVALERDAPATRADLVDATGLGARTVWRALDELRERGLVTAAPDRSDRRRLLYRLEPDR